MNLDIYHTIAEYLEKKSAQEFFMPLILILYSTMYEYPKYGKMGTK